VRRFTNYSSIAFGLLALKSLQKKAKHQAIIKVVPCNYYYISKFSLYTNQMKFWNRSRSIEQQDDAENFRRIRRYRN
jgi:hypothetical protein